MSQGYISVNGKWVDTREDWYGKRSSLTPIKPNDQERWVKIWGQENHNSWLLKKYPALPVHSPAPDNKPSVPPVFWCDE